MCCSGPLADLAGFKYQSSDVVSLLGGNKKKKKKKRQLSNAEVYSQSLMKGPLCSFTVVVFYLCCRRMKCLLVFDTVVLHIMRATLELE